MEFLSNGTPVDPKRARINIVGGTFTDSASDDWTLLTLQVGDITAITAGNGLSGGGTSGAVSLAVNLAYAPTWTALHTFNASVALGANSGISCAAGTTAIDLSLGTGVFKPPTGTFTFQGKQAATATANNITDPGNAGAIPVTTSGVCNLTSAGAETRTLAIPTFSGQCLTLCCNVDGGDNVITVASAFNQAGNTIITLNDAGDAVHLVGALIAGALRWRLIANDGATLS